MALLPVVDDSVFSCLSSNSQENTSTVMKGVLWEQPNRGKLHQRIFSRWKKRYFVLTTDYLVCFKRSSAKVGRSKMGEFLYKTSLNDIVKIEWLKPTKSDKGAIVLLINGDINLLLWSKKNLDEWMYVIQETIERNKIRRLRNLVQNDLIAEQTILCPSNNHGNQHEDLYENSIVNLPQRHQPHPPKENHVDAMVQKRPLNGIKEETFKEPSPTILEACQSEDVNLTITSKDESKVKKPKTKESTDKSEPHSKKNSERRGKKGKGCEEEKSPIKLPSSSKSNKEKKTPQSYHEDKKKGNSEKENGRRASADDKVPVTNNGSQRSGKEEEETTINGLLSRRKSNDATINERIDDLGNRNSLNEVQPSKSPKSTSTQKTNSPRISKGQLNRLQSERRSSEANASSSYDDKCEAKARKESSNHSSLTSSGGDKGNDSTRKKSIESTVLNASEDEEKMENSETNLVEGERSSTVSENRRSKRKDKVVERKNVLTCISDLEKCNSNELQSIQKEENQNKSKASDKEERRINTSITEPNLKDNEYHDKDKTSTDNNNNNLPSDKVIECRKPTSLIRRDDSWQSLVSLTHVGKPKSIPVNVAQRSLYAKHIMPDRINNDKSNINRQHLINIESTVTPSRLAASMARQQWIQANNNNNNFNCSSNSFSQSNGKPMHLVSSSFDSAEVSKSPLVQTPMSKPNITSYQHKLLQLQLLHNSNNIDYIRHYGGRPQNEYQVYGPESITTNHYGYSSMRSNLKSAASEFSFIRPSSSVHSQSTLPHQPHQQLHQQQNHSINQFVINHRASPAHLLNNNYHPQIPNRGSLILNNHNNNLSSNGFNNNKQFANDIMNKENNNSNQASHLSSSTGNKYYVNYMTSDRIGNSISRRNHTPLLTPVFASCKQTQDEAVASASLIDKKSLPPLRDLPSKPNKKRAQTGTNSQIATKATSGGESGSQLKKSSSLTSSIACFFRRAFSRRSKKGTNARKAARAAKLAESCSSSLGNFEDGSCIVPLVPSAFSTGSKSVDGVVGGRKNQNGQQVVQSQRMIDMIEAFTNKTMAAAVAENGSSLNAANAGASAADFSLGSLARRGDLHLNHNHCKPSVQSMLLQRIAAAGGGGADGDTTNVGPAAGGNVVSASGAHEIMTPTQMSRRLITTPLQLNQFGSPLHKSNSISATMGLSLARGSSNLGRGPLLYDNELLLQNHDNNNNNTNNINNHDNASSFSPMMLRSNKAMSTNLTPRMLRGGDFNHPNSTSSESSQQHQFFMSPRATSRGDPLPRPSSIYGQPSMISSPVLSHDHRTNNFGNHRNSLHNHHFREFQTGEGLSNFTSGLSNHGQFASQAAPARRTQMVKLPITLDTTREVAEELASPNQELPHSNLHTDRQHIKNLCSNSNDLISSPLSQRALYGRTQLSNRDIISASPSSGRLLNHYHQQQAIVNPILQSPTMDAIYDNHPALNGNESELDPTSSSHYDNNVNPAMDQQQNYQQYHRRVHESPSMKVMDSRHSFQLHQSPSFSGHQEVSYSPKNTRLSQSPNFQKPLNTGENNYHDRSNFTVIDMISGANRKPSAIVVPSTISENMNHFSMEESSSNDYQFTSRHQNTSSPGLVSAQSAGVSRSPLMGRRSLTNGSHYQQSPLVSQRTRVLTKSDGVQATVIGERISSLSQNPAGTDNSVRSEIKYNRSSTRREPHDNSYESESNYSSSRSNSKTFLVTKRTSKSKSHDQGSSSTVDDSLGSSCSSSAYVGSASENMPIPYQMNSIKEPNKEKHQTKVGSSTVLNSSPKKDNIKRKKQLKPHLIKEDDTESVDLTSGSGSRNGTEKRHQSSDDSITSSSVSQPKSSIEKRGIPKFGKARESSSEPSEGETPYTSQSDSLEKLERERNWITSKLIE